MSDIRFTKRIAFILAGVAVSTLGLINAHAAGIDIRRGFSEVAGEATDAVVYIKVEKEVEVGGLQRYGDLFDFFGQKFPRRHSNPYNRRGGAQTYKQRGQGSGFLISKDGYILTNTHVVGDMDKITVKLADGREFDAKRIGADSRTEVALIKIEADDDLPYLNPGDVDKLEIGEWVIAIGTPFGLNKTLTVGVVSAKGRTNIGITDYEDFIQTDAAINPGNSGGPLLNVDGEVVGINTAIYSQSGGYMGIGFAVPIDMALSIKDQLVSNGYVKRGYIGVYLNPGEVTEAMAAQFGHDEASGILVADVLEDGPADKAGVKSGDIIIELEGKKVINNASFRRDVAHIMLNREAEFTIVRNGKRKTVTIKVGLLPDEQQTREETEAVLENLGFELQPLSKDIAAQLGYKKETGLVVTNVIPGSDAAEKGIKPGMLILEVNRKEVETIEDFEAAVKDSKEGYILLRVKAGNATIFVSLNVS
ncbi:MAG: Do family serine endopeptidase [Kiritimatiellia bacterium]